MASQVLSGATNASYTNNTGQNVRLIINYMSRVTSMTWAGVNVTANSTTIGKDIQNITGELRQAVKGTKIRDFIGPSALVGSLYNAEIASSKSGLLETDDRTVGATGGVSYLPSADPGAQRFGVAQAPDALNTFYNDFSSDIARTTVQLPNLFYVPLTISRGGNFPVELMLASGQSFSAVCGAFNAIVIREDGN